MRLAIWPSQSLDANTAHHLKLTQEGIRTSLRRSINAGKDHKTAYTEAKNAAEFFTSSAALLLGEAA